MCVRIEEQVPPDNAPTEERINGTSISENVLNITKPTSLADRIPKIWEIAASKKSESDFLPSEELAEKESAYGLKVGFLGYFCLTISFRVSVTLW